ncbi:DUF1285 domain-containing protein [Propylenella binzhouense]|uniref:DUF1285 domain-containing protein n=1 Tax=Propylenella binzhouense TaxID=2555902 RepID=A0A964WSE5_9HYPH|nr:DUF1285 domain-containing protein [Propylenella binzhouense]MYZ46730.1 DUF1285 domain-containing protein [Propylenella binzhouense]
MSNPPSVSGEGTVPAGLAGLVARAGPAARERPVEAWNPPDCGDIDMRIAADGSWHYNGGPIRREALVRLFASVLRREPDGRHVLVTPVEKLGISVDDAPFLAVEMAAEGEGRGRRLTFRTNVGDVVAAGPDHPIRYAVEPGTGGVKPYVEVRRGLEALLSRPLVFELAELAETREGRLGVWSGGAFFPFPDEADG